MPIISELTREYQKILDSRTYQGKKLSKQQEWYFLGCLDTLRKLQEIPEESTLEERESDLLTFSSNLVTYKEYTGTLGDKALELKVILANLREHDIEAFKELHAGDFMLAGMITKRIAAPKEESED